jgi:hypothetical protein
MVTRTGMLMEAQLRASEMKLDGIMWGRQTVREGGSQPRSTIDGGNTW